MTNLPPLNDHAFMRMVRKRCEDMSRSMAEIAGELGCEPDDLCRWIMAYKEPKRQERRVEPITYDGRPIRNDIDFQREAERFKAWRRQQEGAIQTRRMLEITQQ